MQCDVERCAICILNNIEYLHKEQSYKNSNKEMIIIVYLSDLCNAMKKVTEQNFIS